MWVSEVLSTYMQLCLVILTSSQGVLLQKILIKCSSGVLHEVTLMRFALRFGATDILLPAIRLFNVQVHTRTFNVLENQILLARAWDKVFTPMIVHFFQNNQSTL